MKKPEFLHTHGLLRRSGHIYYVVLPFPLIRKIRQTCKWKEGDELIISYEHKQNMIVISRKEDAPEYSL